MAQVVVTALNVVPISVPPVAKVPAVIEYGGQLTTWHDDAADAGFGSQAFAAGPVAVHMYVWLLVVLAPPPIEYPFAHPATTAVPVLPASDVPLSTPDENEKPAHATAWHSVVAGAGSHTLAAGPPAVHVYVCVVVTLEPPPIAKPLAQITVAVCVVVPVSGVVPLVLLIAVDGQLTGWQKLDAGAGDQALTPAPVPVQL